MSKSAENKKGVILLLDDVEVTRKKIMSATTDSEMLVKYDVENKPGISNLIDLYMSVTGKSRQDIEKEFEGKNYGEFKRCIADEVCKVISDIQEKYNEILNSDLLDRVLDEGIEFTRKIAKENYELLKERVGLSR